MAATSTSWILPPRQPVRTCTTPPAPRERERLRRVLLPAMGQRYGVRQHYRVDEVLETMLYLALPLDWNCWALSMLTSRSDFDAHHATTGEVCSWWAMHQVMATALDHGSWSLGGLLPDLSPLTDVLPDMSRVGDVFT